MNLMVDSFPYFSGSTKNLVEHIEALRKSIVHHGIKRLCASNIENKKKLSKLIKEFDENNE